jgi:hypothetical protein
MRWRPAMLAAAALVCAAPASAAGCELVLSEHRSARELLRLPLAAADPQFEIVFEHSVLGTTVVDRYKPRHDGSAWRAHLVEERFRGEGYGLPHAAGPGEDLQRDGDGWRLRLDRVVDPLVVRPLPAQRMRIHAGGREQLLGELSRRSVAVTVAGCALPVQGPR